MNLVTLTQREMTKYEVIKRLIRKEINGPEAANLLSISTRQIRRLKAKVINHGPNGLAHGNRGKQGNRKVPQKEEDRIKKLLHKYYSDFKPTHACERLFEDHQIDRDPKTIRRIMIEEKLWKPRRTKKKQIHRKWRERKPCFGQMQQFDGSYEHWFEDRSGEHCLLLAIDDATGKITHAKFAEHEGVFPVFNFWREYLQIHGKPINIYVDKFSTYKVNHKIAMHNPDTKTQFQRAMWQLGIEPITAHSPQAKGRVERCFGTLQDRLIKDLRLNHISTVPVANQYLKNVFIPKFNSKFSVIPKRKTNLHRKISKKELPMLDSIFSRQTKRVIQNDFTISYKSKWYQLEKEQPCVVCKKDGVIVEERPDGRIFIQYRRKYLNFYQIHKKTIRRNIKTPHILTPNVFAKVGHF